MKRFLLVLVILLVVGFTLELGFAAGLLVVAGLGLTHLSHDGGLLTALVALAALLGQGGALAVWRRL